MMLMPLSLPDNGCWAVLVRADMYYWLMEGGKADVTGVRKSSIRITIRKANPYRKAVKISDIIAEIGTSHTLFVKAEGFAGNELFQLVEGRCFIV